MRRRKRPGYLQGQDYLAPYLEQDERPSWTVTTRGADFITPLRIFRRWKDDPCTTPWLFYYPQGSSPQTKPMTCQEYQTYSLGQWVTSDANRCILGKELSRADSCQPYLNLCSPGYDWVSEVGCVKQELRT